MQAKPNHVVSPWHEGMPLVMWGGPAMAGFGLWFSAHDVPFALFNVIKTSRHDVPFALFNVKETCRHDVPFALFNVTRNQTRL